MDIEIRGELIEYVAGRVDPVEGDTKTEENAWSDDWFEQDNIIHLYSPMIDHGYLYLNGDDDSEFPLCKIRQFVTKKDLQDSILDEYGHSESIRCAATGFSSVHCPFPEPLTAV